MPPKFHKSTEYTRVSAHAETEVVDAYAEILDSTRNQDLVLQDIPNLLRTLQIPPCFTRDVSQCVEWVYVTQQTKLARKSANWAVAEQLLRHLTISVTINGVLEVSDVVDLDELVKFCNRLVKFRDNYQHIASNWALFVEASGIKIDTNKMAEYNLTLSDLVKVKTMLQLDDISDSILIDMLGCGRSNVDGEFFNYKLSSGALEVGIKDFAEVLGLLGHYDE